ncbi:Golgi membrane protein 1 isoform X3 [Syngnathoides biaculeatus]|uniref:Golgi membrane protein 1 isoform X3 n=1 Tax=Syngnathoides biaculeatus TaxID=300417 RepID=UPI002ADE57B4|nr:Golgi membrane protein 1 isoform X3 [Syngnathoides biaculeatus]
MGGLVNGRRGGRAPPLMIGALVACILVLGFNYWVSSSRNLELQTKLYELEGQVRRGAVERGAAEVKKYEFQEEIQRQKDQIGHIEVLYKRQLEGVQNTCSQEKATLQQNVSASIQTIQALKGQLVQMNEDLGRLQKELQACQSNVNTLNDKLTYDMRHCNSQVLSQKELCDERVAAAKQEVEKKMAKLILPAAAQKDQAENDDVQVNVSLKAPADLSHSSNLTTAKASELLGLYARDLLKEQAGVDDALQLDVTKVAIKKADTANPIKSSETPLSKNQTKPEAATDHTQVDPAATNVLNGQRESDKVDVKGKPDKVDSYEQALGEDKQEPGQDGNIVMEEVADYNGDDDNEGEFEADKQAELAQN